MGWWLFYHSSATPDEHHKKVTLQARSRRNRASFEIQAVTRPRSPDCVLTSHPVSFCSRISALSPRWRYRTPHLFRHCLTYWVLAPTLGLVIRLPVWPRLTRPRADLSLHSTSRRHGKSPPMALANAVTGHRAGSWCEANGQKITHGCLNALRNADTLTLRLR